MDYTEEIEINLPRDEVVRLFDDPAHMAGWQPGLRSVELLSGEQGQPGARTRLVTVAGRRRTEMIETVTHRDLPDAFHGTYDAKGVHNIVENFFHEAGPGRTRWVNHNVFEFRGAMKIVALLFGRSFPQETRRTMTDFKAFAEGTESARA